MSQSISRRGIAPAAPDLRALELFDRVPDGCIALPVPDAYQAPHLRPGELAIVNTELRQPIDGELFAIRWTSGRIALCQVGRIKSMYYHDARGAFVGTNKDTALCRQAPAWHVGDYVRPRDVRGADDLADFTRRTGLMPRIGDGPYTTKQLSEKLIGQVVGVASFVIFAGHAAPATAETAA